MNALELKTLMQRRAILKTIRDDFNGCVERQRDLSFALGKHQTNKGVRANLAWLVKNGYLTLTRTGGSTKTYTLTEKAT